MTLFSSSLSFANEITDFNENSYIASRATSSDKIICSETLVCNSPLVATFYSQRNFNAAWTHDGKITADAFAFINVIKNSYTDGLEPKAYHLDNINQLLTRINQFTNNTDQSESLTAILNPDKKISNSKTARNKLSNNIDTDLHNQLPLLLANLDMTLTDAFFLYAHDLHNGLQDRKKLFPYWTITKQQPNLVKLLSKSLGNNIESNLATLAPKYPGYTKLKQKLAAYRQVGTNNPWHPISNGNDMKSGDSGNRVKQLQQRLLISGELKAAVINGKFDETLQQAVILFQENMGLLDNGIVDSDTLNALNIPIETRIRQIELNMDTIRTFPDNLGSEYLMVNIPDFSLILVKHHKNKLSMDVAVGGVSHPSCILNSKITYLVANPAWHVPQGIAESELFPILQNGTSYLESHNIDVFKANSSGSIKMINPNKVDWKNMSIRQFRAYQFRQRPGSNNVLGKVKFVFQNQCQIYLHDSIESEVFDASERDLSHGCIRMAEPMLLTNYVLDTDNGWSKDQIATLFNQATDKAIALKKPIPFYIVYLTSWVNDDDFVQFRNDVYNLNNLSNYPVYLSSEATESTTN